MNHLTPLERQVLRHEGFRGMPYRCSAGKLTIGIGRNLDDVGLTQDEAVFLMRNDLEKVEKALWEKLSWFGRLGRVRREVLINMGFNLGIDGLFEFKQTLQCVSQGEYAQAAERMMQSRWAKQVGHRAVELARQMRTGAYDEA